MKSGPGNN